MILHSWPITALWYWGFPLRITEEQTNGAGASGGRWELPFLPWVVDCYFPALAGKWRRSSRVGLRSLWQVDRLGFPVLNLRFPLPIRLLSGLGRKQVIRRRRTRRRWSEKPGLAPGYR